MSYPYELKPLPYNYDALEPYIDTRTMQFHHDKHQKAYMTKLNDALEKWPEGKKIPLLDLLTNPKQIPDHIRTTIVNNGGGYFIHTMFWNVMETGGGGEPTGELADAINKSFGSFESFKEQFSVQALDYFGSGWTWLVVKPDGTLHVMSAPGHDLPQKDGFKPILVLDVWEHAYYLKFQNRRPEYIQNWWQVVNWSYVTKLFLNE